MKSWRWLLAGAAVTLAATTTAATEKRCFPKDFLFGSATAAYQVEGAWNEGGRTPSIWDDFCRERGLQCANVADDFYHRYRDDIKLMVDAGLDTFRFSISWSRVMNWDAQAKKMKPNAPGVAFYHALIDALNANGIAPILTLYHWDLPSELHSQLKPQGWINPAIIDHFMDYAELMFAEFGAKIDLWSTFNEPLSFIGHGYGIGREAPGLSGSKTNAYRVTHNVLLSHGKAVARFRELQARGAIRDKARISIVLNHDYSIPLNASDPADVAAAERKIQFELGWFLSPLAYGKYPDVMRERAGANLPEFTAEEAALVKGSYDLFMLNHYATKAVVDCKSPLSTVDCGQQTLGWESDLGIDESRLPAGARPSSMNELGQLNCKWFSGYPSGYLETIKWTHAHDPKAEILLTENGWCGNETIDNQDQLWYFQAYLGEVHKAITELKIPIIGYTAWSFMDNYEWGSFKPRFGLYYVNFTASTGAQDEVTPDATALARVPRTAAKWYAQLSKTKCLDGIVIDSATTPTASPTKTIAIWAFVVGFMVAVLWLVKRRQASSAGETTPLVQRG